jgi:hypothetical protein
LAKVLTSKEFDKRLKKLSNNRITAKVEEVKDLMKKDTIEGDFINKPLFPKKYDSARSNKHYYKTFIVKA